MGLIIVMVHSMGRLTLGITSIEKGLTKILGIAMGNALMKKVMQRSL